MQTFVPLSLVLTRLFKLRIAPSSGKLAQATGPPRETATLVLFRQSAQREFPLDDTELARVNAGTAAGAAMLVDFVRAEKARMELPFGDVPVDHDDGITRAYPHAGAADAAFF